MREWVTDQRTRERMRRVRQEHTMPEMAVRRLLHGMGYRYLLHDRRLPGCPDLVFPSRRKVIFVHGCFWHGHGCSRSRLPRSNGQMWATKINRNIARDARVVRKLRASGWGVAIVWECALRASALDALGKRLRRFLG
ncbi:very short patch repair endonuclease [Burkholderia cenocepacia]|uniref:very short patch repair endonuclease n=1 Tax=Burkholderia cenocepacia TaxID=95486 RepID=UPI0009B28F08|nr:very short patch repair endonuclease [Burkholderia cenocepacia]